MVHVDGFEDGLNFFLGVLAFGIEFPLEVGGEPVDFLSLDVARIVLVVLLEQINNGPPYLIVCDRHSEIKISLHKYATKPSPNYKSTNFYQNIIRPPPNYVV